MGEKLVMSDYLNYKFQWYTRGIKTIRASGFITLQQLINSIISPKPEMIDAFNQIKKAGLEGNKAEKDRLKSERLFFTTPSAIFDPIRNYDSIQSFLPLGVYEYDDIPDCEILRDYVFEKRKDCIFAFCSPSFTGTKFIFLFGETPTSIKHYKELWFGIAHDLDKFKNLDMSNERVTQPLYNSYDPNAKFRNDAVGRVVRGYKTNAVDTEKEIDFEIPENVDADLEKEVVKKIDFLIDRIDSNAHPQLLGISFLIGGWSGANFISQELAYDTMIDAIERNDYMSKNNQGYITTAKTMFLKGLNFPAEYRN